MQNCRIVQIHAEIRLSVATVEIGDVFPEIQENVLLIEPAGNLSAKNILELLIRGGEVAKKLQTMDENFDRILERICKKF